MKTTGDKILDRRLDQIGGKGLFVKELDRALGEKRSDPVSYTHLLPCRMKIEFPRKADIFMVKNVRRIMPAFAGFFLPRESSAEFFFGMKV